MKLSEFLLSHAIRQGKTHHLATLLKQVGGTLITRNFEEAERVKKEYSINAISYDINPNLLDGQNMGICYIDDDAAGLALLNLERKIEKLTQERNMCLLEIKRLKIK